ncbi:hypothetical protein OG21DRAFT_1521950, partial [Imleria badia]
GLDLVTSNKTYNTPQVLKPHTLLPFSTWKHIFAAGVAQKYKTSDSHGRVKKALEEVFKQYGRASYDERVDMATNVILQNHVFLNLKIVSFPVRSWCNFAIMVLEI